MPARDRVRPDEEDRPAVTAEHASEHGEDRAVVGFEARTGDLALQHGELMTQHEDLDILDPWNARGGRAAPAGRSRAGSDGRSGPHADPRSAPTTPITPARNPRSTRRTSIRHPQGNPTASADAETGVEVVAPRTTTVSSGPWGLSRRRPEGGERSRPRRPLGPDVGCCARPPLCPLAPRHRGAAGRGCPWGSRHR